jgi:arsenate reductase-like glutaredoxin family protein
MVANPSIIQRPIVEVGDRAVLARPIEKALEVIRK